MESLTENSWDLVVSELSKSTFGIVILSITAILVTTLPFWKWIYSIYKENKEKLDAKREKERQEADEMKNNIKEIAKHLPELDQQVMTLSSEVSSFKHLKEEWVDNSKDIKTSINDLQSDIRDLSSRSDTEDKRIRASLQETQEIVNEIKNGTQQIKADVEVLFEGENNEFRIYLTTLHEKHVEHGEPMTREIRQQLRIKFDSYKSRGGNGWAEELYNELMTLPLYSSDYLKYTKEKK